MKSHSTCCRGPSIAFPKVMTSPRILRCAGNASTFVCSVLGSRSWWDPNNLSFGKFFKWDGFISTSLGDVFLFVDIPLRVESCLQHFFCIKIPEWNETWVKELTKQKHPPLPFSFCSFSGQCKISLHFFTSFFFLGGGNMFLVFVSKLVAMASWP